MNYITFITQIPPEMEKPKPKPQPPINLNKMAIGNKKRFGDASSTEIDEIINNSKPGNTQRNRSSVWTQFIHFCAFRGHKLKSDTSVEQLAAIMKDWAVNMRKSNGDEYKEYTVKTMWNVTARILQEKYYAEYKRKFDPFYDIEFKSAREARNAKRKHLKTIPGKRKVSKEKDRGNDLCENLTQIVHHDSALNAAVQVVSGTRCGARTGHIAEHPSGDIGAVESDVDSSWRSNFNTTTGSSDHDDNSYKNVDEEFEFESKPGIMQSDTDYKNKTSDSFETSQEFGPHSSGEMSSLWMKEERPPSPEMVTVEDYDSPPTSFEYTNPVNFQNVPRAPVHSFPSEYSTTTVQESIQPVRTSNLPPVSVESALPPATLNTPQAFTLSVLPISSQSTPIAPQPQTSLLRSRKNDGSHPKLSRILPKPVPYKSPIQVILGAPPSTVVGSQSSTIVSSSSSTIVGPPQSTVVGPSSGQAAARKSTPSAQIPSRLQNASKTISLVQGAATKQSQYEGEKSGAPTVYFGDDSGIPLTESTRNIEEMLARLKAEKLLLEIDRLKLERLKLETEKRNIQMRHEVLFLHMNLISRGQDKTSGENINLVSRLSSPFSVLQSSVPEFSDKNNLPSHGASNLNTHGNVRSLLTRTIKNSKPLSKAQSVQRNVLEKKNQKVPCKAQSVTSDNQEETTCGIRIAEVVSIQKNETERQDQSNTSLSISTNKKPTPVLSNKTVEKSAPSKSQDSKNTNSKAVVHSLCDSTKYGDSVSDSSVKVCTETTVSSCGITDRASDSDRSAGMSKQVLKKDFHLRIAGQENTSSFKSAGFKDTFEAHQRQDCPVSSDFQATHSKVQRLNTEQPATISKSTEEAELGSSIMNVGSPEVVEVEENVDIHNLNIPQSCNSSSSNLNNSSEDKGSVVFTVSEVHINQDVTSSETGFKRHLEGSSAGLTEEESVKRARNDT